MNDVISKSEYEAVFNAIKKTLSTKVEEIELSDKIPTLEETQDNNKVFRGKLSVLFVDMRKSTDLTDEVKAKKMVKIYRSFIRMIIQAIRYSGGETRQFAGDGVMGVFQDDVDSKIKSSEKAVTAARYIITMIDYCLNPLLSKYMDGLSIACGVGICTGPVLVTKVGMRGKEQDDTCENEMGLVWTGQTTNYASRYCSLANSCEIFIDSKTFTELHNKSAWSECSRIKGTTLFKGFVSHEYYLDLDPDILQKPVKNKNTNTSASFVQEIFSETEQRAKCFIESFLKEFGEKTLADFNLKNREKNVTYREHNLKQILAEQKADLIFDCLDEISITLNCDQIRTVGKDFFIDRINKLKELYRQLGQDSWKSYEANTLFQIYRAFDMKWNCYDMLCIMAKHGFPINKDKILYVSDYYDTLTLRILLQQYCDCNNNETSNQYKKYADLLEG